LKDLQVSKLVYGPQGSTADVVGKGAGCELGKAVERGPELLCG